MDNQKYFGLTEASSVLGCKVSTLRSFLRMGLIPHVRINQYKHRILEQWQIDLLNVLLNMKQAGFKTKDLRRYSRLFREGRKTEKTRIAMLTTHKHQLRQEIEARAKAIGFIERQEEIYQQRHNHQHQH